MPTFDDWFNREVLSNLEKQMIKLLARHTHYSLNVEAVRFYIEVNQSKVWVMSECPTNSAQHTSA